MFVHVLLLMLLARVWDAINDPLMGIIVDRKTLKRGKMKPYILYAAIPIAVLTVLIFTFWCKISRFKPAYFEFDM